MKLNIKLNLRWRLFLLLFISGMLLSILLYASHHLSTFSFLDKIGDILFSNQYNSHVFFSMLAISIPGILLFIFIEIYIFRRILRMAKNLKNIDGLEDLSLRISEDELGDEVSKFSVTINKMLVKLEKEKISKEKLEKALVQSEKLSSLSRFSANIADHINQSLMSISNCFETLKSRSNTRLGNNTEIMSIIEIELKKIRTINFALEDFYRIDSTFFSDFKLSEIIDDAVDVVKWRTDLDLLNLKIEKSNECFINGFKEQIMQVIITFLLNSLDASKNKDEEILLKLENDDENNLCLLHIYDNGSGLSPEIKNKLFEPFNPSKNNSGLGLNLFVSYKIIKNHNGEIIYDENYKQGTHFIIKLPIINKSNNK